MALPITPGGAGAFETGIYFDPNGAQQCRGVLVDWQNPINPTPTLALSLWDVAVGLIATETVTLAGPGLGYTTAAFGAHPLIPGATYCVSVFDVTGATYNGLVFGNPFVMPRPYSKYNVQGSYVFRFGAGIPNNVNNGACALLEPVMV